MPHGTSNHALHLAAWRPRGRHVLLALAVGVSVHCARPARLGAVSSPADALHVGMLEFRSAEDRAVVLNEPGKLYLVDFMALGCKPCMEEIPDLERIHREFGSSGGFQLVTVVCGWGVKHLANVRAELAVESVDLYADESGLVAHKLGIQGFPTKYLIRDGRVILRRVGGGAGAYSVWQPIIREHLRRKTSAQRSLGGVDRGDGA